MTFSPAIQRASTELVQMYEILVATEQDLVVLDREDACLPSPRGPAEFVANVWHITAMLRERARERRNWAKPRISRLCVDSPVGL